MSSTVYSFDVYDTLITRPLLRPTIAYHLVAKALHSRGTQDFSAADYYRARRAAEQRAREASAPRDDCRFTEIFEHFPELEAWGLERDQARACELNVERQLTRVIHANAEMVRRLLREDATVVFLSDMYLPTEFICELLREHVAPVAPESVFVSGDLGVSKHSGHLFEHVLTHLAISPAQLNHYGDNTHSDVAVPKRLGINATHYTEIAPNRYEQLPRPRRSAPAWLCAASGVERSTRLALSGNSSFDGQLARVTANVVAPVLCAFVAWVLKDARARGIERLYFVSRDGQIMHKIAQTMRVDGDPQCDYLYGSRQTWYLASLAEAQAADLEWAWRPSQAHSGQAILKRLALDTTEVLTTLAQHGFDSATLARELSDSEIHALRALLASEPLAMLADTATRERRERCESYLRQAGLYDDTTWALVDIGWFLNAQRALNQVLRQTACPHEARGYYFGIRRQHNDFSACGPGFAFISEPGAQVSSPLQSRWLFKFNSALLIEHLFTASDHRSVDGYVEQDGEFVAYFKDDSRDPAVLDFARAVHQGVLKYCDELAATTLVDPHSLEFRARAYRALEAFCMRPQREDVAAVAWLPTNADVLHDPAHQRRLASKLTLGDVWNLIRSELNPAAKAFFSGNFTWLAGSAALSAPFVRRVCRLLLFLNRLKLRLQTSKRQAA